MRRDLPFDEIADEIGLASPFVAEKDYYVTQALLALSQVRLEPFTLVFAGGTSLSKAHNLTHRMSEDIDIKVLLGTETRLSNRQMRDRLRDLRQAIVRALQTRGFELDPERQVRSHRNSQFTQYDLPYPTRFSGRVQLRPDIRVETDVRTLKRPPIELQVSSFAAQVLREAAEIPAIPCTTVVETAADKLVALSWRVFSRSINEGPTDVADDERLVRHVYDLHTVRDLLEDTEFTELARTAASQDAEERKGQAPTFAADPQAALRTAPRLLTVDASYAAQYRDFMDTMVYGGDRPSFAEAVETVSALSRATWGEPR